jgi:hypothetical protein
VLVDVYLTVNNGEMSPEGCGESSGNIHRHVGCITETPAQDAAGFIGHLRRDLVDT